MLYCFPLYKVRLGLLHIRIRTDYTMNNLFVNLICKKMPNKAENRITVIFIWARRTFFKHFGDDCKSNDKLLSDYFWKIYLAKQKRL